MDSTYCNHCMCSSSTLCTIVSVVVCLVLIRTVLDVCAAPVSAWCGSSLCSECLLPLLNSFVSKYTVNGNVDK